MTSPNSMLPAPLTKAAVADAAKYLAKRDVDLAFILRRYGPPPLWSRKPGFSTLIQIILEQQVSLASAASMYRRLSENIIPFAPDRFVELGEPHLRSLGMTRQKTAYCIHLAETIVTDRIKLSGLSKLGDEDVRAALMQIKGIGAWSADIYLLMALRRPDVWPASDLALARAATRLKRLRRRPTADRLLSIGNAWRPFRSVAARMLWQYYLAERRAKNGK